MASFFVCCCCFLIKSNKSIECDCVEGYFICEKKTLQFVCCCTFFVRRGQVGSEARSRDKHENVAAMSKAKQSEVTCENIVEKQSQSSEEKDVKAQLPRSSENIWSLSVCFELATS